ncbi:MAG: MFS transporter [Muribaculaceae bacterium]|nr:MFS transporter [Muribaculaceae bacterium]
MIKTGKLPISVMTYAAIMSISLIVNLPGLAVTPMLGTLSKIFPDTSQLEKQLLTVLPNLLIIPFILFSGKLSLSRHKISIVVGGLVLFAACSVWYMFASSMTQLIIISCLLGCGAGLLIPFSTGLIADTFSGKYRMSQMGLQSGISNSALMVATFVVGWLSAGNWHLPFAVYLVCIIPLALTWWLKYIPKADTSAPASASTAKAATPAPTQAADGSHDGFYVGKIISLFGVYFFITFASISISYYCPFLVEKEHWSSSITGTVTAIYFLFIFIPGYALPYLLKLFRGYTFVIGAITMMIGIGLFAFIPSDATMCVGAALAGFGYGLGQPLLYDKASLAVKSENKATMALALVLVANYAAIVLSPFIIDGLRSLFHASHVKTFAFILCFSCLVAYTVVTFILRKKFAFNIPDSYYETASTK